MGDHGETCCGGLSWSHLLLSGPHPESGIVGGFTAQLTSSTFGTGIIGDGCSKAPVVRERESRSDEVLNVSQRYDIRTFD